MPVFYSTDNWKELDRTTIKKRLKEKTAYNSEHYITYKSMAFILKNPCQNVPVFNKNYLDMQMLNGKTIAKYIKQNAIEKVQKVKYLQAKIESKKKFTDEKLSKKIKQLCKEIDIIITRNCSTAEFFSIKDLADLILEEKNVIVLKRKKLSY